jgi:hypothetical protein
MNKSHITVRCSLHDLPHQENSTRVRNTHCSDILQECVKGILILRNVSQRFENVEWTISHQYRQGRLRVAHQGRDHDHLHPECELALPLLEAVEIFSK